MLDILSDNWLLFLIGQYPNGPLGGLALTLILSIAGLLLSFPLSVLLALCRTGAITPLRWASAVIVYAVRGMPIVMLVFWSYFLVPALIGHSVTGVMTLIPTLVIYEAAYLSEVIRAGIQALPQGQQEAARSLGFGYWRTTSLVILPQAISNMIPGIVTQFISTIKDTSIGYVISVQEMTYSANSVNNNLLTQPFQVFAILALTYFCVCYVLTQLAARFERRTTGKRTETTTPPRRTLFAKRPLRRV
ncbi:amino acid ABC transporter permease [Pandoraea anhela]|uniref:Amino acid ABC transporter permease n=1 Tax=Pandoraea anhela TaxID=2508295 RepID=A0A5E4W9J7_9BURK|nr:amino acid ABC transporter permease [Pandoraea anhela]VVE21101.1 amino acid ABC transporter permease [Pandoraea anhela]